MTPLSAVMIVKNEAERLQECFAHLDWVSEILVLDTGSQDSTATLAAKLGAEVHHQNQWQGFGLARQEAVNLAANDYVFSIDADEIVSESLQNEIIALMRRGFDGFAYRIPVKSYYLGKPIRFCGWQNEKHLRIFDRHYGNYNDAVVHESVITTQPIKNLKACLFHFTYPTKAIHKAKMRLYGDLGAKKLQARGISSNYLTAILHATFTFIKMYVLSLGFLDGWRGFTLCKTTAWGTWYKYYALCKLNAS